MAADPALAPEDLTRLLNAWNAGDASALERVTPVVYQELHRIARIHLTRERDGHLLQPTALINEAFLRLMGGASVEWAGRAHFFAVVARMMRQILIDFARSMQRTKRGSRVPHLALSFAEDQEHPQASPVDILDVDAALQDLAKRNPRQAQVVELRYFGGLENAEVGEVLGISEPTVRREWRLARARLYARLQPKEPAALDPRV